MSEQQKPVVGADQKGACAGMNAIIADLPKTVPTAHVISSEGCKARPDRLHFTPEGYRELGRRYGVKMAALLGHKGGEPNEPATPTTSTTPSASTISTSPNECCCGWSESVLRERPGGVRRSPS